MEIGYPWAHLLPRDAITLEDANVLAECVRGMTREELRVFGAVLEVEEPYPSALFACSNASSWAGRSRRTMPAGEARARANECVRGMTREELRVFGAVLEVEEPCSFHEAGTIAMDIYDYELVDSSERGYAITALRYAGAGDEILEILEGFTDFDALGRSEMEADGVRETSFGSVKRLTHRR